LLRTNYYDSAFGEEKHLAFVNFTVCNGLSYRDPGCAPFRCLPCRASCIRPTSRWLRADNEEAQSSDCVEPACNHLAVSDHDLLLDPSDLLARRVLQPPTMQYLRKVHEVTAVTSVLPRSSIRKLCAVINGFAQF